jgi:hypothetical protein
MNQPTVVHPDMFTNLTPLAYPARCTIQIQSEVQGENGEITKVWANLTGLTDLACRLSPVSGVETLTPDQTFVSDKYTIELVGVYPQIVEKMRAVVTSPGSSDALPYDITNAEIDGQHSQTRLSAKVVS